MEKKTIVLEEEKADKGRAEFREDARQKKNKTEEGKKKRGTGEEREKPAIVAHEDKKQAKILTGR